MSLKHIIIFLSLILVTATADAKNYYRFKDTNGRLVVKDYLPNSAIKSGYEVINESGRVIEKVAPIMSDEEKAAERIRLEKIAEQKEKERKMRQHDRMLLRQYRTIDDIKRTEENQTASLEINVSILSSHNKTLEKKLTDLQSSAANFERKGKAVPKSILNQIKATKEQIGENNESIARYEDQVKTIREQFKKDLVRFKELKAMRIVEDYAQNQRSMPTTTKVECSSVKSCERSWKLAQIFAHENASNKLEIVTDSLIISSKPKSDDQLGLSITRIPAEEDAMQIVLEVQCLDSEAGQKLCKSDNIAQLKEDFIQYISQKDS
jgi:hypothetical protein